ncbi:hypothetical protein MTP99_008529 [Tenebrio molitor]|nr:hypothetical protein MTP99_008529 [Tenebrio molitor]
MIACRRCGKRYKYKKNFQRHVKYECQKPPQFACYFCPSKFTQNRKHQCHTCGKSYRHKPNLYRHRKYECAGVAHFRCFYCSKAFFQKVTLNKHLSNVHAFFDKRHCFQCEKCGKSYKHKGNLNQHLRSHYGGGDVVVEERKEQILIEFVSGEPVESEDCSVSDSEIFTCLCNNCGKMYKSKGNLQRHLNYECGKEPHITCPLCGLQTKYRSSMKRHVLNRHPGQLYACPGCDKAYKSINSLRRHVKYMCGRREPPLTGYTHLENSFICNKCDKIYKSKSSMRRHLVYECGKMPNIECPIMGCPYKSKLRDRMSQHVKMVHKLML